MSIYNLSKDDIAQYLTVAAGVPIASADFTVQGVRATVSGDSTSYNSKIAIQMNASSAYKGIKYLFYDRLDLSALANFAPYTAIHRPMAYVGDLATDALMLATIRDALGIQFDAAYIKPNPVTAISDGSGVQVVIEATTGSIGWINSYTLKLSNYPNIANAFNTTVFSGF